MSPCMCSKAARKRSRSSCAPAWKRSSICIRKFNAAKQNHEEVLLEVARKTASGRALAARMGCAWGVLFDGAGTSSLRTGNAAETDRAQMERQSRRLGKVSRFRRGFVVFRCCLSRVEANNPLAPAQPVDCHLYLHWRNPRRVADRDGLHPDLPLR